MMWGGELVAEIVPLQKRQRVMWFLPVALAAMLLWHSATAVISGFGVRRRYLYWPSLESNYFHIRYTEADSDIVPWLAAQADLAAELVGTELSCRLQQEKPWLVIVPDGDTMRQAFGWGKETGALGVYYAGTVKILSPHAWDWLEQKERLAAFSAQGPLVHEVTHLMLDIRAGGNYPRWFSEGLAQLMEYRLLGFEWLEEDSSLQGKLYTLQEMDGFFDRLESQPLAYRQALSLVTYLYSLEGMEGINSLIGRLAGGKPFYACLEDIYCLNRQALWNSWLEWFHKDCRWFLTAGRK